MKNRIALSSATLAAALSLSLVPLAARADDAQIVMIDADNTQEQDEAQQALKSGLVRPLEDILVEIRKTFPGDIIEIEFEKDDGRFIYEIEMIRPDGKMIELKVDAMSLAVLEVEDD